MEVRSFIGIRQEFWIQVAIICIGSSDGCDGVTRSYFHDQLFDVDVWRRFGMAARNINIPDLWVGVRSLITANGIHDLRLTEAACINAFLEEVKQNKSIAKVDLELWEPFITNRESVKELILSNRVLFCLEQLEVYTWKHSLIAAALHVRRLRSVLNQRCLSLS
jgi:hypothetical protein